ncbi:hypothetical protein [Coleofasciculus sp. H7-2]|uniref:hypothetical protein n=1 Tax=Coleofasciculus sp. H7-2 TaxID=3351545 RepID=UPI003670F294
MITQLAIVIVSQIVVAKGMTTRRPAIRSFFKSCLKRWITDCPISLQLAVLSLYGIPISLGEPWLKMKKVRQSTPEDAPAKLELGIL